MERDLDQMSFEELLGLHRSAVKLYSSSTNGEDKDPDGTKEPKEPKEDGQEEEEKEEESKEDSGMDLIRRIMVEINVNRRENQKLREEVFKLELERKKVTPNSSESSKSQPFGKMSTQTDRK